MEYIAALLLFWGISFLYFGYIERDKVLLGLAAIFNISALFVLQFV